MNGTKDEILAEKIQRKKQGSKGFKRALAERNDYISKTVKELPLEGVNTLVIEHLKGLKNGRRFTKKFQAKFQRWTYPTLVKRLKLTAERQGVLVAEVNPAYTSQTCSRCGSRDKNSRNGEIFTCTSCGYSLDADINASVNISMRFRLPEHLDPVKFCLQEKVTGQTLVTSDAESEMTLNSLRRGSLWFDPHPDADAAILTSLIEAD